jgi:hypothetical protein
MDCKKMPGDFIVIGHLFCHNDGEEKDADKSIGLFDRIRPQKPLP